MLFRSGAKRPASAGLQQARALHDAGLDLEVALAQARAQLQELAAVVAEEQVAQRDAAAERAEAAGRAERLGAALDRTPTAPEPGRADVPGGTRIDAPPVPVDPAAAAVADAAAAPVGTPEEATRQTLREFQARFAAPAASAVALTGTAAVATLAAGGLPPGGLASWALGDRALLASSVTAGAGLLLAPVAALAERQLTDDSLQRTTRRDAQVGNHAALVIAAPFPQYCGASTRAKSAPFSSR